MDSLKEVGILMSVLDAQLPAPRYTPGLNVLLVHVFLLLVLLMRFGPFHVSPAFPV
jgi:hypothetical protein